MITISDVGPSLTTFPRQPANNSHSSSGRITALALAADGPRMYAGSFAGLWRSNDAGETWSQLKWPQPTLSVQSEIPGALYAPHIFDVAASPTDPNLVLVSALDSQYADGRDGVYRSTDGGDNWTLVFKAADTCNIAFAPDDPKLVYVATTRTISLFPLKSFGILAVSRDGGATWKAKSFGSGSPATSLWHVAVGPLEPDGKRRVYAIGDSVVWYSTDGGHNFVMDLGVGPQIINVRTVLAAFQSGCGGNGVGNFGSRIAYSGGDAAQILAVHPQDPAKVFLATAGGALGPTYYSVIADGKLVNTDCKRLAGEASLWLGDFSRFELNHSNASWALLPGPPVYSGFSSPSGNCYVATKATSSGFLLFFSDNSHVHVSAGVPTDNSSWHRLDGMDASVAHRSDIHENVLFMHADPHAIAFSSDFEITLRASTENSPYDKNSELDQHIGGRLWLANDGGAYFCDDGGKKESSWQMPSGLETLDPINIAGLFGIGSTPALYFGCGDNNDFFSRDGGAHWGDPGSGCGDCDAWFADTARADRVIQFLPRRPTDDGSFKGFIGIIKSDGSEYPNAGDGDSKQFVQSPKKISFADATKLTPYAASDVVLIGYRPLILTLATEAPPTDIDLVIVEQALDGTANLLRTTALSSINTVDDWHDTSKAVQVGPQLPAGAIIPQASGGHANAVFYVGDRSGQVYKLDQAKKAWNMIVPNKSPLTPVANALRWFVDPYDPDTIYVLDKDGVKVSVDGGGSWLIDARFTRVITADGNLTISSSLLQDMLFLRGERQTRFAFGTAGVFWTENFGVEWLPIVNSIALPGRPESGFFDALSNPSDRALYVECEGRSVLRIAGIPGPPPFEPPPPFDLLEFAALEY